MRQLNVTEFLPDAYEVKGREQDEAGAMVMGRTSYEEFAAVRRAGGVRERRARPRRRALMRGTPRSRAT